MTLHRAFLAARPLFFRRTLSTSFRRYLVANTKTLQVRRNSSHQASDTYEKVSCALTGVLRHISFWKLLRKLGIPNCRIVIFRRSMKRLYYVTGLATIVRGAFPMIIGDLLAQTVYPYLFERKNKKHSNKISLKEINWCRTSHFAVIGAFLAPIAKRWNLIWGRRIRRYPPGAYMTQVLLLDALFLTPMMVFIYMVGYDFRFVINNVSKLTENGADNKLRKRYETPMTDMVLFYITTKPLVAFAACFVLPCAVRNVFRRAYSFLFYCFVSNSIVHAKLGPEITKRKSKRGARGQHYDGGGGFVCMFFDKLSDILRGKGS